MGNFSANTAREEARLEELVHCVEERRVQEHRSVHTEWVGVHSTPRLHGGMKVAWGSWGPERRALQRVQ